jgi:hypothetical protein
MLDPSTRLVGFEPGNAYPVGIVTVVAGQNMLGFGPGDCW